MTESQYRGADRARNRAPLMYVSRVEAEVLHILFDAAREMTLDEIDVIRDTKGSARHVLLDLKERGWMTIRRNTADGSKRLNRYLYALTDNGTSIIRAVCAMKSSPISTQT